MRLLTDPVFTEDFDIAVDELTDQYVEGEILGEERERAEQYFFKSAERRNKLKYALALKAYKPQFQKRWWTSPQLRIAASILIVVGVAFALWPSRESDVDKGVLALQGAYRDQRPLEARISGWKYAPPISQRGNAKVDYVTRDRAASLLQTAVNERRDAASLHGLGQSYLAAREFDKAIDQFEAALKLSPDDAKVHSDVGAALLEKGKVLSTDETKGKSVEYFATSLTHLTRAIELDDANPEALFNRALVYQYLGLPDKAEQDWHLYLEKDPNSKWSDEARGHLQEVEEIRKKTSQTQNQIFDEFIKRMDSGDGESAWKIVRDNQNRSGNVVVEQLLDNYLERGMDGELQRVAFIAGMDLEKNGERFYADVLNFYKSANPQQRAMAQQARGYMKQSHAGWGQLKAEKNVELFEEAKRLFAEAGDVAEAAYAEYGISLSYDALKKHETLQKLESLISTCTGSQYVWLKIRCLYIRAGAEYAIDQHSKAVASAREAVKLAESKSDPVGLLNALISSIEFYRYLRDYPKVLAQIQRASVIVNSITLDPIQSVRYHGLTANAFAAAGFNDAAVNYLEEAIRIAREAGITARVAYKQAFLGTINGKRRHFETALSNVSEAVEIATSRSDSNLLAYSALQKGDIYREMGDCDNAVNSYTQAIDIYKNSFPIHLYQAHKGRLLCYFLQKDDVRAQQEIATTLPLIDNYRHQISEENNRNTFFDTEQSVYDAALDFELSHMNNPERAFEYLQDSRARSLLDRLSLDPVNNDDPKKPDPVNNDGPKDPDPANDGPENPFLVTEPESSSAIKEKLPERVQLLQYVVLEDRILIWVISRGDIVLREAKVQRKDLNETIERYHNLISSPSEDSQDEERALAKELYSLLIQPVESLLDSKNVICVIPDKNLGYISFGALISPASGKYLIDDYVLTVSQSPSVFLRSTNNATQKADVKQESVLSVGNPRFDHSAFPELDDLPDATQEAIDVASVYKATPLVKSNATRAAVLNQMIKSDVIHLAGHSVLDELPMNSRLLLAKGDLSAEEIYGLKLAHTRLVVLSACQTGAERYYDGEGMSSLARVFIGAGVPLVVASLWPVDSAATRKLMVSFHHERRQGSSAEGLAKAQREMLHGAETRFRNPFYWAAFTLNGGYAEF
jgi:CHAT domain-containing protein/Flp pilus assembly protein TadD